MTFLFVLFLIYTLEVAQKRKGKLTTKPPVDKIIPKRNGRLLAYPVLDNMGKKTFGSLYTKTRDGKNKSNRQDKTRHRQ